MEGPWKIWRTQRIENNSPDLDSYGKPLPSPPAGYYWERLPDKSWELKKYLGPELSQPNVMVFEAPAMIEHVVLPSDTLQGICLKYRVSAVTLRQFNNFSGTAFKSRKYLRIPIEPGLPVSVQLSSHEILIQRFKNETGESEIDAKYYLEGLNWDLHKALAEWRGDENWMSQQLPIDVFRAPPIVPAAVLPATINVIPLAVIFSNPFNNDNGNENDELSQPLLGNSISS